MWDGNKNKLEHELELVIGPAGVGLNPWLYISTRSRCHFTIRDSFSTSRLFKYYNSGGGGYFKYNLGRDVPPRLEKVEPFLYQILPKNETHFLYQSHKF